MSGFGKRNGAVIPAAVILGAQPTDGVTSKHLPFSFPGLCGGAAVSVAIHLLLFYAFLPWLKAGLASPSAQLSPAEIKAATSAIWWWLVGTGIVFSLICCTIAHWVARFLGNRSLWPFALIGVVCGLVFAPETVGLAGPAVSCTYWRIAKKRAA